MRKRRSTRTQVLQRSWWVREHGGAPGWAIVATVAAIGGILAYATL